MKNILIIIVTYNGSKWIENCINSAINSSILCDIYVVDNCSEDNTTQIIAEQFPSVIVHKSSVNLGFGKGNNLGLKYALQNNYNFVFLLNQDASLGINTLERMINVCQNNNDYGILSPIHLDYDGTKLERYFSDFVGYINNAKFYSDCAMNKSLDDIYDFKFINAAAWLIPLSTLQSIGGFDPIFWHYGEDDNYCQRVLFHNLKIGVVTNAFVKHHTKVRQYNDDNYYYSERYFADFEKQLQAKYANINFDSKINLLNYEWKKLIRLFVPALFQFNIKEIKGTIRKASKLNAIFKIIHQSRSINIIKGSHYIN